MIDDDGGMTVASTSFEVAGTVIDRSVVATDDGSIAGLPVWNWPTDETMPDLPSPS